MLTALFDWITNRRHSTGGALPDSAPGDVVAFVIPGEEITDPDRAEALGLTVEARRMRQGLPIWPR